MLYISHLWSYSFHQSGLKHLFKGWPCITCHKKDCSFFLISGYSICRNWHILFRFPRKRNLCCKLIHCMNCVRKIHLSGVSTWEKKKRKARENWLDCRVWIFISTSWPVVVMTSLTTKQKKKIFHSIKTHA